MHAKRIQANASTRGDLWGGHDGTSSRPQTPATPEGMHAADRPLEVRLFSRDRAREGLGTAYCSVAGGSSFAVLRAAALKALGHPRGRRVARASRE